MKTIAQTYHYFTDLLEQIYEKSPLQRKKIQNYLATRDEPYFKAAEEFAKEYIAYLNRHDIPINYVVDAYLKLCQDALKCQKYFMKTGRYPLDLASEVYDALYNDKKTMQSHMIGLAVSQFLWPSHYEMHTLFGAFLHSHANQINSYLEIGPGHGLFLSKAMDRLSSDTTFTAVDISPISIEISQSLVNFLRPDCRTITYHTQDMLEMDLSVRYDFITMGEVLEHVNFPDKLLIKLRDLLSPNGRSFISTCVNAPSIDHVYHFKTIDEIRMLVESCGLDIIEERILPVDNVPMEQIISQNLTINWCAIIKRHGDA